MTNSASKHESEDFRRKVSDAIQRERGKGVVCEYLGALDALSDIMQCVTLNEERVTRELNSVMQKDSSNPLGAILRLFGHKMVSDKNVVRVFAVNGGGLHKYITVDSNKLRKALEKYTSILGGYEKEVQRLRDENSANNNRLVTQLKNTENEVSHMRADTESSERALAGFIQKRLVSAEGTNVAQDKVDAMTELADIFGMEICSDANSDSLPYSVMFSELLVDDADMCKKGPCIMKDGKVVIKGFVYRTADGNPPVASEPQTETENADASGSQA